MLGPGDGARRRHDQAAELRPGLTLTTRGELETTSARVCRPAAERRFQEALAGFHFHYPNGDDRAVKASPAGELRSALTALISSSPEERFGAPSTS